MSQSESQPTDLTPKEKSTQPKMVKCSQMFRILSTTLRSTGFMIRAQNRDKIQYFTLIKDGFELQDCMACPQDGIVAIDEVEKILKESVNKFMKLYEESQAENNDSAERGDKAKSPRKSTKNKAQNKKGSKKS